MIIPPPRATAPQVDPATADTADETAGATDEAAMHPDPPAPVRMKKGRPAACRGWGTGRSLCPSRLIRVAEYEYATSQSSSGLLVPIHTGAHTLRRAGVCAVGPAVTADRRSIGAEAM